MNFCDILQPISVEAPSGADIRAWDSYFDLRRLRNEARQVEARRLADEGVLDVELWRKLYQQALSLLIKKTKDLELMTWCLEAIVRLEGFAGLQDALQVSAEFVEVFWNDVFPLADEEGDETKVAALLGLAGLEAEGTLVQPLNCVPLLHGEYSYWQCRQAADFAELTPEQQAEYEGSIITLAEIENAVKLIPGEQIQAKYEAITQCQEAFSALVDQVNNKLDAEVMQGGYVRRTLVAISEMLAHFMQPANDVVSDRRGDAAAVARAPLTMIDRERAVEQLQAVADYFLAHEPHSPIAYSLARIVRWTDLSLPDLIDDLIIDESALAVYRRIVGIN